MNAALIWIFSPGICALLFILISRFQRFVQFAGTGLSIIFASLAWWLPLGQAFGIGPLVIEIAQSFTILGRSFVLESNEQPLVAMLYVGLAFWFGGCQIAKVDRTFIPLGLGITALLVAALLVQPFLYAALIIEIIVLASVILLTVPKTIKLRGVLRFLTFETLAMPFILITGWMLVGVEANPGNTQLFSQVVIFLALGFGLLFAIFPFHTWIPMVAEDAHPYATCFIFYIISITIPLFGLNFLDRYSWLYTSPWLFVYLRLSGILMALIGGLGAIFQRNLGRLLGFIMLAEIGNTLLSISIGIGTAENRLKFAILFALLFIRGLSLGILAVSITSIKQYAGGLDYNQIKGAGRAHIITVVCLFLAILSLIGFPLTAGFLIHLSLWQRLFQQFPLAAYTGILSSIGLLAGGLRAIAVLVMGTDEQPWGAQENRMERLLLILATALIILIGIVPQGFFPFIYNLSLNYLRLAY